MLCSTINLFDLVKLFVNKIRCDLRVCDCTNGHVVLRVHNGMIVISLCIGWLVKSSLRPKGEGKRVACEAGSGLSLMRDKWV